MPYIQVFEFQAYTGDIQKLFKLTTPYIKKQGEHIGFNRLCCEHPDIIEELGFDICYALLFGNWEGNWYQWKKKHSRMGFVSAHTAKEWVEKKWQYNNQCFYCGKKTNRLTRDHIIPVSKGGTDCIENIVPACWQCNFRKRAKSIEQFKEGATLKML